MSRRVCQQDDGKGRVYGSGVGGGGGGNDGGDGMGCLVQMWARACKAGVHGQGG